MQRTKLEEKYTVVCKKCKTEYIDSAKKPNQRYYKHKCPYCKYDPNAK